MKLISLFGVLLAISPVFAAKQPGVCAGQVPEMTLGKCNHQPCTYIYEEYAARRFTKKSYFPCVTTDPKIGCAFSTLDKCLAHGCAYVQTSFKKNRRPTITGCTEFHNDAAKIKANPPTPLKEF